MSSALPASAPVTIAEIRIDFEGSMKPVVLRHETSAEGASMSPDGMSFSRISLVDGVHERPKSQSGSIQNARPTLIGEADLTFRPSETKVFEISNPLREAGDVRAVSATFSLASELFDLVYVHTFQVTNSPEVWWGERSVKKKIVRDDASSIIILPKPPKLELRFIRMQEQYYTNEHMNLQLEVINGEEVDSIASLNVRLVGDNANPITLKMASTSDNKPVESDATNDSSELALGRIPSTSSKIVEICISPVDLPSTYDLTMKAAYHLVSDLETPVSRSMSIQLEVINPFEANYDFSPRIHPDPWPSFFSHHEGEDIGTSQQDVKAHGLAQKWCLTARYASFATEELIVEDVDVEVLGVNGGIQCHTHKLTAIPEGGVRVTPRRLEEVQFDSFTQKISLDDRGTATLDVSLAIKWRRDKEGTDTNTTTLAVPRLLVSSGEPRVLASISYSTAVRSVIHFDVIIENPSNHFLTFGLTMEPSEKFAFSGIKQSTLQLVPLSRRTIRFRLLPCIRGDWIGPIHCVIRDRYFQKVLKIAPTEGMKVDKEGLLLWVPPEEDC
jgi:hypothetical protein